MPSTFSALDTGFPSFTGGESTEQKVNQLYDYTFMLLENLRYILRNLSPDNFSEGGLTEISNTIVNNIINGAGGEGGATLPEVIANTIMAERMITNTFITDELYSNFGAIADLVVYELRTDYTKALRYLSGNTSPIDYLHIHDEEIEFITGTVKTFGGVPETEQLHHGTRYFWWTDSSKTQMTSLESTAWPVYVYQYDELVKGTYRFDTVEGNKIPELVFGAGYGQAQDPDRGRGFVRKNTNSFDLWLKNRDGEKRGIFIGDAAEGGYTDIAGLRKPTKLDFSAWDSGSFTETLDGDIENSFTIDFDAQDRPIKFTDSSGHETVVIWDAV